MQGIESRSEEPVPQSRGSGLVRLLRIAQMLAVPVVIGFVGSIGALALGDPREDVFRGMNLRRMLSHQMHYYRWHGWIARIDYHAAFESFFGPSSKPVDVPFQQQAKAGIYAA